MKLALDPMPAARAEAERQVNAHFDGLAHASVFRDQAHARKARTAAEVLNGAAAPAGFAAEAALRGLSVIEFAQLVAAKAAAAPTIEAQELDRQQLLLSIAGARTLPEIADLTAMLGEGGV